MQKNGIRIKVKKKNHVISKLNIKVTQLKLLCQTHVYLKSIINPTRAKEVKNTNLVPKYNSNIKNKIKKM